MTRSNRNWRIYGLSILFAAVPSAFAVVRAIRTGDDFRYLWVALASLLSALVVMVVAEADRRGPIVAAARSTWVFVVATLVAVFAAWLLGVRVGPGSLLVGSAFGLCYAASCTLNVLARP
jgi:hypothetical protein